MSVAALLLLLVVLLTAALFTSAVVEEVLRCSRWRWRHFSYFRRIGIPGPKPSLIWGNIVEYHSTDHYKVIGRWIKEYGDIFGFYDGDVPFVVTMDLDLIETVNIRHFKNFMSRGLTMMVEQMHPFLGKSIIYVDGCQWKSIRNTLARGFSAAKLKLMMPLLEEDVAVLLSLLEEHAKLGEEVNMLRKYEQLAMDFLFRGSFGVDERFQGRPDHPFETIARTAGRKLMTGTLHMVALLADVDKVIRETAKVIEVRRRDRSYRKPDILQNLLDAEYVEDEKQKENRKSSEIHTSRSLTTAEVITSAVTLFVAGYETTATSLSYLTFVLAKYLDVQEKVRQEIYSVLGTEGKLDFDTLMKKLEYFDQVIYETFRLYPPGLTFAPGNEDQLNNAAFMPFGMGPRNCVGRSLAMLKAKLTLGKLLQRYRLELGPSQM
ncbi:hypothetical protein V5799_018422, partial [Amblyomma americanum]